MTNITNLNRVRKKKARADKEKRAEENRAAFGRTKAEKSATKREGEKLKSHIDGHKQTDADS